MSDTDRDTYGLPSALIGRADLARLAREIEQVDNEMTARKGRRQDTDSAAPLPEVSRDLNDFMDLNKLDLGDGRTRTRVKENLRALKDHAPVIHMSFATVADPEFLRQLTAWIRGNVHPQALISTGLQPSLVGGVYIRTPSHVYDFSVRSLLAGKRDVIINELEGYHAG